MDINQLVIQAVKSYLGKPLTIVESNEVLRLYLSMSPEIFKGQKLSNILPVLGKVLGEKIKSMPKHDTINDMRSYQLQALNETNDVIKYNTNNLNTSLTPSLTPSLNTDATNLKLNVNKFLGINDLSELKMLFNPSSMLVHYYLVLDSDYRDTTNENSTNITKFKWNYTPTQSTIERGFCNSVGVIRDIIGMRMYQPRVPYKSTMDTDAKRVSILIEEFAAQSFIAENGRRFHFILRPEFVSGATSIELSTEDYNDGIFNFRKPITKLDTVTISLGNPLDQITYSTPCDRFMIAIEFTCYKSDK